MDVTDSRKREREEGEGGRGFGAVGSHRREEREVRRGEGEAEIAIFDLLKGSAFFAEGIGGENQNVKWLISLFG